jgi:hypothetical protein
MNLSEREMIELEIEFEIEGRMRAYRGANLCPQLAEMAEAIRQRHPNYVASVTEQEFKGVFALLCGTTLMRTEDERY